MQAGIHDEAHRAQHFVGQPAVPLVRIREQAEFLAERFGVERPAFRVRHITIEATEARQRGELLLDRDLEMMAGRSFVQ